MDQIMDIVLIILAAAGALALVFLALMFANVSRFIKEVRTEIIPSLHLLQETIEEVNGELAKIDSIMASVQGVTDKVNSTTKVAQDIISSPLIKLASFSFGAQKAIGRLIKRK